MILRSAQLSASKQTYFSAQYHGGLGQSHRKCFIKDGTNYRNCVYLNTPKSTRLEFKLDKV